MTTRKQLETCQHPACDLIAEWNGSRWVAACLVCCDCWTVLSMRPRDRADANQRLGQLAYPPPEKPSERVLLRLEQVTA